MRNLFTYSIRKLPACQELDGTPVPACFNVIATDNLGNKWDAGEHATREAAQAWIDLREKSSEEKRIADAMDDFNYVGSRHHY